MKKIKFKKIDSCKWYHQTTENSALSIFKNGFFVDTGGNQKYTEGIYFLNHPEGDYGDVTLKSCIKGNFIDFSKDEFGNEWVDFKNLYDWKNYTDLTKQIQKDYDKVDGILFQTVLVVWYPKCIKETELA